MSLCESCISNHGGSCTWEIPDYPKTFRCQHHITSKSHQPPLLLVGKDKSVYTPSAPTKPHQVEWVAHSVKEPEKCIYYAKLP